MEAKGLEPSNLLTASQALYQLSYAPVANFPGGGWYIGYRTLGQTVGYSMRQVAAIWNLRQVRRYTLASGRRGLLTCVDRRHCLGWSRRNSRISSDRRSGPGPHRPDINLSHQLIQPLGSSSVPPSIPTATQVTLLP